MILKERLKYDVARIKGKIWTAFQMNYWMPEGKLTASNTVFDWAFEEIGMICVGSGLDIIDSVVL